MFFRKIYKLNIEALDLSPKEFDEWRVSIGRDPMWPEHHDNELLVVEVAGFETEADMIAFKLRFGV